MIAALVVGDPACFDGQCQARVGDVAGQPQSTYPSGTIHIRPPEEAV
jgi:hypothetical protein